MHAFKLFAASALLALSQTAFAQADRIVGTWLNASQEGRIQITKSGQLFYGKIAWLKNPNDEKGQPKTDKNNPDPSLKNKPLQNLIILRDFEYEDGKWVDGTIYDPKSGRTYNCELKMSSDDRLDVRGYIGISLIGRTETWTRVK